MNPIEIVEKYKRNPDLPLKDEDHLLEVGDSIVDYQPYVLDEGKGEPGKWQNHEPTIRELVTRYYTRHIDDPVQANRYIERYLAQLEHIEYELKVE
jgi:hypothetical protein